MMEDMEATAAVAKFTPTNLPDLGEAEVEQVEMVGEYWSPEHEGEKKRVFFVELFSESVVEPESGETRELVVVKFAEPVEGELKIIRNGSRRLVGIFESMANTIKAGDAFEITYLGKRKNKNNAFKSDNWSIKRLIVRR